MRHRSLDNLEAVVAAVGVGLDLENCELELDPLAIIDPDCPSTVCVVGVLARVAWGHQTASREPCDESPTLWSGRVVQKVEAVVRYRVVRPELHEDGTPC